MTTIVTRQSKGGPLSWAEADANFTNLNTDKLEINTAALTYATITYTDTQLLTKVSKSSDTGSAKIPSGTTAQRDSSPNVGWTRFNTTLGKQEVWNGTAWVMGGGATGGGSDDVFYENAMVVTTNYTLTTGKNAMSAGPISIANGVTVTVPDGSVWSIV